MFYETGKMHVMVNGECGYAYAYEQSTKYRRPLKLSPAALVGWSGLLGSPFSAVEPAKAAWSRRRQFYRSNRHAPQNRRHRCRQPDRRV